jgi:hypothetical protein
MYKKRYKKGHKLLRKAVDAAYEIGDPQFVSFTSSLFARTAQALGRTAENDPHYFPSADTR